MRWKVMISLLVMAAVLGLLGNVNWSIGIHNRHMQPPDEVVRVGDQTMTRRDFVAHVLLPEDEIGPYRHALIDADVEENYFVLYILASLAGASAAVWLLGMQHQSLPWMRFSLSYLLAAFAGAVSFLVVRLCFSAVSLPSPVPYPTLAILPVLSGLFLTVFFEWLKGFFKRLLGSLRLPGFKLPIFIIILGLSILVTPAALAQKSPTKVYFVCIEPKGTNCVAVDDDQKRTCPKKCTEWKKVFLSKSVALMIETNAYSYSKGTPRANEFVIAAAGPFDGAVDFSKGEVAPTIAKLYSHPERYGFKEISKAVPDAIVVWPNVGGIVVNTGDDGELKVLYPSDKLGGKLTIGDIGSLNQEGEPKFLLPTNNKS
ncbi:MAG: hypothetical protein ACSLFQ_21075 [Thermoanaerobaculia bacterium]